jgi:hypothetical protein
VTDIKAIVLAILIGSAIMIPLSILLSSKNNEQKTYTQLQIEKTKLEIMILKKQCEVSK